MTTATVSETPSGLAVVTNEIKAITSKVRDARTEAKQELVERGQAVDLLWTCAVAREHLVFLGPPGVAKSMLVRNLMSHITDAGLFDILLNKDTVPQEMWGPISMTSMKQDRYERIVDGYMPTANIGFWDELFRANSTILNGGLTLINERMFKNGTQVLRPDLWLVAGATNMLPGADAEILSAFADRFAVRLLISEVVSQDGLLKIADGFLKRRRREQVASAHTTITADEMRELQSAATRVVVPPDVLVAWAKLISDARGEGLNASTRRYNAGLGLMQANAVLNDEDEVKMHHLRIFKDVLWNDEEQIATADEITKDFAGKTARAARGIRIAFEEFQKNLGVAQQEADPKGDLTGDQIAVYRKISAGLGKLVEQADAAIEDAERNGEDPAEIISVREQASSAHATTEKIILGGL